MKKLNIISLVFLSLLFIPLVAGASLNTNLSYGLKNNSDVKELQEYLISKDLLTGSATGNFYSLTLNAVKKYQKSIGVTQSGYVGILTRTAINKELTSKQEVKTETGTTPLTTEPGSATQAQINLLQKQLDALKAQQTTTPTPTTSPVWDACKNIEGIQSLAPAGMYADNGNCFSLNVNTVTPIPTPTPTLTPTPTPTSAPTPTPQPTLTEVKFDGPFASGSVDATREGNISVLISDAQVGDIITLTFQGQTFIKTVDVVSGRTHPYYSSNFYKADLSFSTEYPYTLKLQRGNQYAIKSATFKTLSNIQCDSRGYREYYCYNYDTSISANIDKIKFDAFLRSDNVSYNSGDTVSCKLNGLFVTPITKTLEKESWQTSFKTLTFEWNNVGPFMGNISFSPDCSFPPTRPSDGGSNFGSWEVIIDGKSY